LRENPNLHEALREKERGGEGDRQDMSRVRKTNRLGGERESTAPRVDTYGRNRSNKGKPEKSNGKNSKRRIETVKRREKINKGGLFPCRRGGDGTPFQERR